MKVRKRCVVVGYFIGCDIREAWTDSKSRRNLFLSFSLSSSGTFSVPNFSWFCSLRMIQIAHYNLPPPLLSCLPSFFSPCLSLSLSSPSSLSTSYFSILYLPPGLFPSLTSSNSFSWNRVCGHNQRWSPDHGNNNNMVHMFQILTFPLLSSGSSLKQAQLNSFLTVACFVLQKFDPFLASFHFPYFPSSILLFQHPSLLPSQTTSSVFYSPSFLWSFWYANQPDWREGRNSLWTFWLKRWWERGADEGRIDKKKLY